MWSQAWASGGRWYSFLVCNLLWPCSLTETSNRVKWNLPIAKGLYLQSRVSHSSGEKKMERRDATRFARIKIVLLYLHKNAFSLGMTISIKYGMGTMSMGTAGLSIIAQKDGDAQCMLDRRSSRPWRKCKSMLFWHSLIGLVVFLCKRLLSAK